MNNTTPAKIEQSFRKMLGNVNPYMCLIDIAVKEMIKNHEKQDIHIKAKEHGYPNIITKHINLPHLSQLVHISHLLYIQSAVEVATENLLKLQKGSSEKCKDGSFFDIAIHRIHQKKHNLSKKNLKCSKQLTQTYVGIEETLIIDYYRLLRNEASHGSTNFQQSKNYFDKTFNENNLNIIKNKFGFMPNNVNNLTENDVYLSSVVWQFCIKQLAKKCIDIEGYIMPILIKKYKNYTLKRKQSSIRHSLKLEYLLSDEEIDDIIISMVN